MRVSFDQQAGTAALPEVVAAMEPFWRREIGLPAALHQGGQPARAALAAAREQMARLLGAESPENVFFTGNGTEAVNLAIKGTAWANLRRGRHVVTTTIEHPATANSLKFLETQGFEVTRVAVDEMGRIDPEAVVAALRPETVLVAVHHANHDIGTIQPIEVLGPMIAERGIPLFVDAIASAGWQAIDVQRWEASLVAVSPHRFHGPKGVGVLYRNRRARLASLIHGGDQEQGFRAGTENVPAIVGAGVAAAMAVERRAERAAHAGAIQRAVWDGIRGTVSHSHLNGPMPGPERLPSNLNIAVEFVEGEGLALALDLKGFAIGAGAACVTKNLRVPPVLAAIGCPEERALGAILLSFSADNTLEEATQFLEVFPKVVHRLRSLSPRWEEFAEAKATTNR